MTPLPGTAPTIVNISAAARWASFACLLLCLADLAAQDPPAPAGQRPIERAPAALPPDAGATSPAPAATPRAEAPPPEWATRPAPASGRWQGDPDLWGEPAFRVRLDLGGGRFEHDTDGSNLEDRTDGGYFRLSFEGFGDSGLGGGLRLEGIASDDDLFADAGFNAAEAGMGELFVHLSHRTIGSNVMLPVRIGLVLHGYTLEDQTTNAEVQWSSIGVRFEVEPEITLSRGDGHHWVFYGEAGLGLAATQVETEPATFDADASTLLLGLGLGTRVRLGPALLGIGYVHRSQHTDDSDTVNGSFFRGIDASFNGLLVTVGVTF